MPLSITSPTEFREFEQDCVRWAEESKDEHHRKLLLDVAKECMRAALEVERSIGLIDEEAPLAPKTK